MEALKAGKTLIDIQQTLRENRLLYWENLLITIDEQRKFCQMKSSLSNNNLQIQL